MFIIYFDVCATIILLILLASILIKKTSAGRTSRLLILLFSCMLVSAVGDLMSCYGSNYYTISDTNTLLMYIYNYAYFLSHNTLVPAFLLYICSNLGIWHIFRENKPLRYAVIIVYAINILIVMSNIFTKKVFYIDDNMEYQRGPWLYGLYGFAIFFSILGLVVLFRYRRLADKPKLTVLFSIYPVALLAIVIQAVFPRMPVEMFTYSILCVMFIVVIHSKEENVNPVVGAKKYSEGIEHLKNILVTRAPSAQIFIKFTNWRNIQLQLGLEQYNVFLAEQSSFIKAANRLMKMEASLYYLESGLYGVMVDDPEQENVAKLARYILRNYDQVLVINGLEISVDARVCVVRTPEDMDDYSSVFSLASNFHKTMPNTDDVQFFSEYAKDKEFILKTSLEEIIEDAIKNHKFSVHYQPVYSTEEKRFTHAEAFVRLKNEEYGYVSPALFIPEAERNGLIHKIGDFVLEEVCRFIGKNDIDRLGLEAIGINLSMAQCIENDLLDKIDSIIKDNGIRYNQIMFEITESGSVIDTEISDANIMELHNRGAKFALDGYGMGYSNIQRITKLPIDLVKLDKTFMNAMDDEKMWTIVRETINMFKEMGMEVLAEGVELEEAASRIQELGFDFLQGCEFMQGYYFCKPLPEAEFVDFMNSIV